MKKMKSLIVILLAIVIVAGCSGKASTSSPAAPASGPSAASQDATPGNPVSDVPIDITVFMVDKAGRTYDTDIQRALEARSNVTVKWQLAPANNGPEVFNLTVASGNLPDVIIYSMNDLLKYGSKGAFEPLNELVEQYAPNFAKLLKDNEQIRRDITNGDGNIYTFPMIAAIKAQYTFLVRQDWLDKLNLPAPTTRDEWVTVLKAFRDNDMNGNGKHDEIPLTINNDGRATITATSGINEKLNFYESFGIDNNFFVENDKILYGPADPRWKDYLAFMNMLYSEKLLDQEYLTADKASLEQKLSSGVAGASYDFNHYGFKMNTAVGDKIPGYHLKAILPPKTDDGKLETRKQLPLVRDGGHAAIAKTSKYKEEIVKYFDYIYSDEGKVLLTMGIEGKHWEPDANGQPAYTDYVLNNPEGIPSSDIFDKAGINRDWPMMQSAYYEAMSVDQETTDLRNQLENIIIPPFPKVKFTDEEQMSINEKMIEINTYVSEMTDKFIMGIESLDNFDTYVATLNKLGLPDMIKIQQAAVDRYNS